MDKICLNIAGIKVRVASENNVFMAELKKKYSAFLSKNPPQVDIRIVHEKRLSLEEFIKLEKGNKGWALTSEEFSADISKDVRHVLARMAADETTFNSFLRVIYTLFLLRHGGFLAHAAGLAKRARGFIFAGRSESGKTTAARRMRDFEILSDELVAVRKVDEEFRLFSTPFRGEFTGRIENVNFPAKAVFFLTKNKTTRMQAFNKLDSLLRLLECVFFFCSDFESNRKILKLVREFCYAVPGYSLNIENETHRRFVDEIFEKKDWPQPAGCLARD